MRRKRPERELTLAAAIGGNKIDIACIDMETSSRGYNRLRVEVNVKPVFT